MSHLDIAYELTRYTLQNSNFDTKRNYISMSNIFLPADVLINQYRNGFQETPEGRLKCYKGYQMEADLMRRLNNIYGTELEQYPELSDATGLFKGHPEARLYGKLLDCKSVLLDEWLPTTHVPKRVFWQMNGYMLLDGSKEAILIYESRENGIIKQINVKANTAIQDAIREKMNIILSTLAPASTGSASAKWHGA